MTIVYVSPANRPVKAVEWPAVAAISAKTVSRLSFGTRYRSLGESQTLLISIRFRCTDVARSERGGHEWSWGKGIRRLSSDRAS